MSEGTASNMTHSEYADGLRRIADWYEVHPEVPLPHDVPEYNVFPGADRQTLKAIARALESAEKRYMGELFYLSRWFGALKLQFITNRNGVCTARVVGSRVVPARPAEPECVVDVVEWDCDPLFDTEESTSEEKEV